MALYIAYVFNQNLTNMSKHTPDFTNLRLTVDETGESGIGNIQDLNGNSIAMVQEHEIKRGIERNQFRQKLAIEIAKRWNACAGMENPAEEIALLCADVTKWHEEAKRLAEQNFQLRKDKAWLIEALKEVKRTLYRCRIQVQTLNSYASVTTSIEGDIEQLLTEMEQK